MMSVPARSSRPTVGELEGLVSYADRRVAVQQRRVDAGGGEPAQLAQLQRLRESAAGLLARERRRARRLARSA